MKTLLIWESTNNIDASGNSHKENIEKHVSHFKELGFNVIVGNILPKHIISNADVNNVFRKLTLKYLPRKLKKKWKKRWKM